MIPERNYIMVKVVVEKSQNDYDILKIKDARFYTTNHSDKFHNKVKTKGVTIYVNPDDEKILTAFGLKVYKATDNKTKEEVTFVMSKFSGNLQMYDTESKTKKRVLFDDEKPNVKGENYEFALMKFEDNDGNEFVRVVAMLGKASELELQSIDYFGVDDEFQSVDDEK